MANVAIVTIRCEIFLILRRRSCTQAVLASQEIGQITERKSERHIDGFADEGEGEVPTTYDIRLLNQRDGQYMGMWRRNGKEAREEEMCSQKRRLLRFSLKMGKCRERTGSRRLC